MAHRFLLSRWPRRSRAALGDSMRLWKVISIVCGLWAYTALASPLPADVEKFVKQRNGCDYYRGEPYPEDEGGRDRREFLIENMKRLCTGSDKELARLKVKYQSSPKIMKILEKYESDIEATGD